VQLTQDQIELQDLLRGFFAEHVTSAVVRKRIESPQAEQRELLDLLSQLGLREGFCGSDAPYGAPELGILSVECGASLMPEPVCERLLCEGVFPRLLGAEEASAYSAALGGKPTAVAPRECCSLKADAKGKAVSGEIAWSFGGADAETVLAVASVAGAERLVVFSKSAAGVSERVASSLDLTVRLRKYTLKKAPVFLLSEGASATLLDLVEVIKASEAYGVARRSLEITCEYVKTREQFSVPVGGFQAVQQKLADSYAASESLGALARFAAWAVVSSPEQRALTSRAAIAHASSVAPAVCESCIQCLGGIGFTWEHDLHLYLRRAKMIAIAFPNSEARSLELIGRAVTPA
jgi:alkylation response protein AidB-like acyl-CoA dehydrogenase